MSSAQDPFYIVKEEIQDSVNTLQATFHQWEHIPVASGEQTRLTKELLSNCDSIEWQVDELEKAISVAARDPSLYGIDQAELERRTKWTKNTRTQSFSEFLNRIIFADFFIRDQASRFTCRKYLSSREDLSTDLKASFIIIVNHVGCHDYVKSI
ncbi:syntaxin-61-like protein isoform X1 [Tanacetum coccineum]|uniref:Syntaxin-61-like protein isoform X1 n=1 Tax=Tanacetum coccineum TaxID=301880 RepID=A0ABQ4ZNJ3_9ASTR